MDFKYFKKISSIMEEVYIHEQINMEKAVYKLVLAIEQEKSIFSFGASHAGILSEELFYRAGGLVVVNPIFGKEIMLDVSPITKTSEMERLIGYGTILAKKTPFNKGDVLIVHSVSGRNAVAIDLVLEAKKIGVDIIAITNITYSSSVESKHPSCKRLYEIADIIIDNHGELGDACITIEGLEQKVSPTSTVIGATILNSIVASVVEILVQHGMNNPPVFYSANINGGDEKNKQVFEKYQDSIHYKL